MGTFSERIKELMNEHGYNTITLGHAVGVYANNVSTWINNNSDVKLSILIKLSNLFGVSIEFLAGRIEIDEIKIKDTNINFYDRLSEILEEKSITKYNLNKHVLNSKSTIYQWKKGSEPRLSSLIAIADYLDVTIDYLVGRE